MNFVKSRLARSIAMLGLIVLCGPAYAQNAGAPSPGGAGQAAAPTVQQQRSQKSLGCSKQADSQNLHGKPRKQFMSKCKKS